MSSLTGEALGPTRGFNWVQLVDLLVCGILGIFFLFYFNRLFGTVVSYGIRAWTWRKYRAYVDITALQISLLGGRIFFKSVRYHAHNVTVLVHEGQITWRYWLGAVQEAEVFEPEHAKARVRQPRTKEKSPSGSDITSPRKPRSESIGKAESAEARTKKELPCRISVKVSGVEAFIYNRSPVYDSVLNATLPRANQPSTRKPSESASNRDEGLGTTFSNDYVPDNVPGKENADFASKTEPALPELPAWLRMLPVHVECKRAAAVLGNQHTTSVITARLEKAAGNINAGPAGPLDIFKLLFNFDFEKVRVAMKPNRDFKQSQTDLALHTLQKKDGKEIEPAGLQPRVKRKVAKGWHKTWNIFGRRGRGNGSVRTHSSASLDKTPSHDARPDSLDWRGLRRYLDDQTPNEHEEWQDVQYAKASTLADCDRVAFKFYWDIPGKVPAHISECEKLLSPRIVDDINGSKAPDYGLELGIYGGFLCYGPWADRQRASIQTIFIPATCVDAVPSETLRPGEWRVATIFKIFVSVEKDVTLRIPTREPSKDEKWRGRANEVAPAARTDSMDDRKSAKSSQRRGRNNGKQAQSRTDARSYGWLDIIVKADSTVNYLMDMFPGADGYKNILDLDVKGTEMTSSVNHGLLWRSGALTLQADLSNPYAWNTLRRWPFTIVCNDLELFILRDHMFLIIDIVNDWSAGAGPDFYTFVPYFYALDMTFNNFKIFLNVNDANIINDPADFDKNDFLTLEGKKLRGVLGIPLEHYRPQRNNITFDVLAQDMRMRALSPIRSTLRTLLKDKQVATLPELTLQGSYSGYSESMPGLTDLLRMDIKGTGLSLKAYGFLVRQFINLKEDYFGDFIHFKTLEEFQEAGEAGTLVPGINDRPPEAPLSNELDVILCIVAEDATVLFPANVYSASDCISVHLPLANLDLRVASYYLDMGLNLSPISISEGLPPSNGSTVQEATGTQIYIEHVDLDGHRAFGLPPVEPAYACTWVIDVGRVSGECTSRLVRSLVLGAQAFAFSFTDGENAWPLALANVFHDATFVQLEVDEIRLGLPLDEESILLQCSPISVQTSDLARTLYSQRINVSVPQVTLSCVSKLYAQFPTLNSKHAREAEAFAFIQTGITIDVLIRKVEFEAKKRQQLLYIARHDLRTYRAPFLYDSSDVVQELEREDVPIWPPAMTSPDFPVRLKDTSNAGLRRRRATVRRSSFSSSPSPSKGRGLTVPSTSPHLTKSRQSGSVSAQLRRPSPHLSTPRSSYHDEATVTETPSAFVQNVYMTPNFGTRYIQVSDAKVPPFTNPPLLDNISSRSSSSAATAEELSSTLGDEAEKVTVVIKATPGIRAYLQPKTALTVANLLSRLKPSTSEDVMDTYQVQVLAGVIDYQQERSGSSKVVEIQASVADITIRIEDPRKEIGLADELNLTLRSVEQAVRLRTEPSESGLKRSTAIHTVFDEATLTLNERRPDANREAARLFIGSALLWMNMAPAKSIHVAVGKVDLDVPHREAAYITAVALRVVPDFKTIQDRFTEVIHSRSCALLQLISALSKNADAMIDPPFLSRMSYTLRAFPDHFRNQDSWKIVIRLRFMFAQLSDQERHELETRSKEETSPNPRAISRELTTWAQWRNWDVPDVTQSVALQVLVGSNREHVEAETEPIALKVTARLDSMRLRVGDDSKGSEVLVEDVSLGVESTPPAAPTGLMLVEENKRRYTVFQVHSNLIAFSVDWTAFEVAQAVAAFIDEIKALSVSSPVKGPARSTAQILEDSLSRHDFHVVFSTDQGSFALQSLNLRHISSADGLKMSLIGTTRLNEQYGACVSALVNVDSAITELHIRKRKIWQTELISPSLYVDHRQVHDQENSVPVMTLVLAYDTLNLTVKEQLPGILHLVDTIIVDEVSQIFSFVQSLRPRGDTVSQPEPEEHEPVGNHYTQFNVALLAGKMHVEIALLQSLAYHLDGAAASLRVEPNLLDGKLIDVDFDIGKQSHSFVNTSRTTTFRQGILELPPVNGQVKADLREVDGSVSAAITVKRTNVEAAAVHAIAAVLNRPEVQKVLDTIQEGVQNIKEHVDKLDFGSKKGNEHSPSKHRKFTYDISLATGGVKIAASAPQKNQQSKAHVVFGLGSFNARATNKHVVAGSNPMIPTVKARIDDIGARLWIDGQPQPESCGHFTFALDVDFTSHLSNKGIAMRELTIRSNVITVSAYPQTASTAAAIINHLHDKIRALDLSKEIEYLRHFRDARLHRAERKEANTAADSDDEDDLAKSAADLLSTTKTTVELNGLRAIWHVSPTFAPFPEARLEDAVLTLAKLEFTTKGGNEARLVMLELMLQLAQGDIAIGQRSLNSALLPEIGFSVAYWSEGKDRSLAFKATGKPLDLRLESSFIVPVSGVQRSIDSATALFNSEVTTWQSETVPSDAPRMKMFDTKHLAALLVEADFAGARVYMQGSAESDARSTSPRRQGPQQGRYGQFAAEDGLVHTTLQTPGIALKVEYNSSDRQPTVNGEMRVDASSNTLHPNVVPLVLEVSNSIKRVFQGQDKPQVTEQTTDQAKPGQKFFEDDSLVTTTPAAIFGKTKVDLGLRICRQAFGLSCQPIARVDANAALDDFYLTINTVDSAEEYGHFFAVSAVLTNLSAQVKHTYSRESTLTYNMESITLSLMNSKHLNRVSGINAILKINPTSAFVNGKQLQDLLLFREIWIPPEIRDAGATQQRDAQKPDDYLVRRYQMTAAAAAFPWNATVAIAKLSLDVDLGRSIGKSSFTINNMWASQQKTSSWEQNLCIGMDDMSMTSTGRMSGLVELAKLGTRMSIKWPQEPTEVQRTPLIQASIGFSKLRAKAAFDYQAFAFGDIEGFDFLMYNVRQTHAEANNIDRLVAVLDCERAFVFCTSTSPAQAVGLFQAFDRLIQERQAAYAQSLKDIEKHLRRQSTSPNVPSPTLPFTSSPRIETRDDVSISLHTDVVVTVGAISFGVFPSTFYDSQLLKLEANTVQARFAVGTEKGRVHSSLGMTLGQLQVALAGVRRATAVPKSLDIGIDEVISSALQSKGGTILRVPKVVASMQTWQKPHDNSVDYIFKSLFDGKIDVGWNLSRINFIQGMWATHARALASRLGKALPESALKITAGPDESAGDAAAGNPPEKITAQVSLPQFRYDYRPLEPPIIETPQLRDMGEATPPLEWIGLNRDRLPNVTHQIIIVSLLQVAKEVEDAYEHVLSMRG